MDVTPVHTRAMIGPTLETISDKHNILPRREITYAHNVAQSVKHQGNSMPIKKHIEWKEPQKTNVSFVK